MALKVGVVGVGHLGRHHARILASLPGVDLVAVVDSNRPRAEEIAAACASRPLFDHRQLVGLVDAVTVAVPTERHLEIALPFLEAGVAVLVEKPMARSLRRGRRADRRRRRDRMSSWRSDTPSGSIPRLPPRVRSWSTPRFVEVHRLGTFPERSLDIDVVFDLMIHDLDVVLSLVGSEVEAIEAVGVPVLTRRVDIANAGSDSRTAASRT